ncbi:response regulator transcription factor [Aliidiomarina celeris]|uniref:response regulator transcription factor n=1 Tax=Aliidiomarina celeris TaxID=2249428 RepID=UPI000DEBEEF5|nr:response regulator transcription factor [Aliidiomarina celeris]
MKILLVEDDKALSARIQKLLENEGFRVDSAEKGSDADFLLSTESYDAMVLDLGLPDGSGVEWLQRWRRNQIEVVTLILTARDSWGDKAAGFNAGADDYVTKPFEPAELVFRLKALIRRAKGHAHPEIQIGELQLNTHTQQVYLAGLAIKLTAQELRLLSYLMHAAPAVVSRIELSEHVYDRDQEPDSNVIDVQISRLRKKLGGSYIVTERGHGYRVCEPEPASGKRVTDEE